MGTAAVLVEDLFRPAAIGLELQEHPAEKPIARRPGPGYHLGIRRRSPNAWIRNE